LAHIQPENLQNVQKMHFWHTVLGVNGLKVSLLTTVNIGTQGVQELFFCELKSPGVAALSEL